MAYNHNGTELLKSSTNKKAATKEANEYMWATGNAAYIEKV
tara:strand:+ start:2078 stop:2200 length:123 start_codon:yes stop_codon:yes gene_type:complete